MSKAAAMENFAKNEKQLSLNLTLSDIFKKHIRPDTAPVTTSVSTAKKVSTAKQIISTPSAQARSSEANSLCDPIESSHCAQIALEGALSRWKEAIEWRESNKDMLEEKARAFYKSI